MGTATTSALFSKTQQAVLGLLFTHTDEQFYLREIIRRTGMGQGAVQRELAKLTDAGIIFREQRGNHKYFGANPANPVYHELQALIVKSFGLADKIALALQPLTPMIEMAFIFGSYARGEANANSDVDLFILGDLKLRDVVVATDDFQMEFGREVNPIIFRKDEYLRRLQQNDHFLTSLQDTLKIFLMGDENEFIRLGQ